MLLLSLLLFIYFYSLWMGLILMSPDFSHPWKQFGRLTGTAAACFEKSPFHSIKRGFEQSSNKSRPHLETSLLDRSERRRFPTQLDHIEGTPRRAPPDVLHHNLHCARSWRQPAPRHEAAGRVFALFRSRLLSRFIEEQLLCRIKAA